MTDYNVKIKICGITSLQDARYVAGARADYLGFIFYEKSPRYIPPSKAGAIINWIEGPEKVGVFVNQPHDEVNEISRMSGIDIVQLHGNESPEYCRMIKKPIIKVFHMEESIQAEDVVEMVKPYEGITDYLMFDTKSAQLWGGTGKTFNWNLLKNLPDKKKIFLSGGLNSDNIQSACREVRPFAVDVSSGVEISPGVKDYDKIDIFFTKTESI